MAGLDEALGTADAVLTGEGRLDAQTARGKAPAEVARRARAAGVPVAAIAGAVDAAPEAMFDSVLSLDSLAGSLDPRRHARSLLRRAARQAVNALSRPA